MRKASKFAPTTAQTSVQTSQICSIMPLSVHWPRSIDQATVISVPTATATVSVFFDPNLDPSKPPTRKPSIVIRKTGRPLASRKSCASQFNSSTKRNSHWKSMMPMPVPMPPPIHMMVQSTRAILAVLPETADRNAVTISPKVMTSPSSAEEASVEASLQGNMWSPGRSRTNSGIIMMAPRTAI